MTVYSVTKARRLGKAIASNPPIGTGPNSPSFFMAMAVMNVISVATLMLWGWGVIHPLTAFNSEAVGFALKWCLEIWFGDFGLTDYDLWFHHAGMAAGMAGVYLFDLQDYAHVILHLNTIHAPLLLKWARKLVTKGTPAHRVFDGTFHYLWPIAVAWRFGATVYACYFTTLPMGYKVAFHGLPIVDYMWTPWKRYFRSSTRADTPSAATEYTANPAPKGVPSKVAPVMKTGSKIC
jgi:hypothetical protein